MFAAGGNVFAWPQAMDGRVEFGIDRPFETAPQALGPDTPHVIRDHAEELVVPLLRHVPGFNSAFGVRSIDRPAGRQPVVLFHLLQWQRQPGIDRRELGQLVPDERVFTAAAQHLFQQAPGELFDEQEAADRFPLHLRPALVARLKDKLPVIAGRGPRIERNGKGPVVVGLVPADPLPVDLRRWQMPLLMQLLFPADVHGLFVRFGDDPERGIASRRWRLQQELDHLVQGHRRCPRSVAAEQEGDARMPRIQKRRLLIVPLRLIRPRLERVECDVKGSGGHAGFTSAGRAGRC